MKMHPPRAEIARNAPSHLHSLCLLVTPPRVFLCLPVPPRASLVSPCVSLGTCNGSKRNRPRLRLCPLSVNLRMDTKDDAVDAPPPEVMCDVVGCKEEASRTCGSHTCNHLVCPVCADESDGSVRRAMNCGMRVAAGSGSFASFRWLHGLRKGETFTCLSLKLTPPLSIHSPCVGVGFFTHHNRAQHVTDVRCHRRALPLSHGVTGHRVTGHASAERPRAQKHSKEQQGVCPSQQQPLRFRTEKRHGRI